MADPSRWKRLPAEFDTGKQTSIKPKPIHSLATDRTTHLALAALFDHLHLT
jgi:hypothetical protein